MTTAATRGLRAAVAAAVLIMAGVVGMPAYAADDFGQHVRTCAQSMGFSGDMNPGMHHGRAGWDPNHTC